MLIRILFTFLVLTINILSFCHYKNKNVDISRVTAILGIKISDKNADKNKRSSDKMRSLCLIFVTNNWFT